ncbi:recombinase family protein [Rhabdothermincola salaria]|uniref:recombinase family protein n=1 Tax=Rhabdothermincola salaria TaxID=2903142 RepID=UPI001E55CC52|nr:recombinase family protein [Rhabdothermincola salaria]MCD9624220.1 recombinase family protein [Rhabdothermincola salaria]
MSFIKRGEHFIQRLIGPLDIGVDTSTQSGDLIINIMANFAQFERKLIGQRTKGALAVRRSEGVKLGRPVTLAPEVTAEILSLRSQGLSYRAIAEALNDRGVPTAQGGRRWYPATVRKICLRNEEQERRAPS